MCVTDNEFFKNCIVEVVFFYSFFNSAIDQCIRVFPLYIEDKKDVVLLQRAKNNSILLFFFENDQDSVKNYTM